MNGLRLDKWLWFARIRRTRTQAAKLVEDGCVRINAARVCVCARPVRIGDVLTIALEREIRVLRVVKLAERRGSAEEARHLFEELTLGPCVSPCAE